MINELHSIKAKVYSPVKMNTTLNAGIAKPEAGLRERVDEVEKQVEELQSFDEEVVRVLQQQDQDIEAIANKIVEIDEKNENQDQQIKDLQDKTSDLESFDQEVTNKIKEYDKHIEDAESTIKEIKDKNDSQDELIEQTNKSITDLQTENENQDRSIELLEEQTLNLEEQNENQDVLIENLQNQIVELETENENLKNQIPVGEPPAGEYITINDSSDMEFEELRIGGNSWQETRSGKNLTDYKDWIRINNFGTLSVTEDTLTYNVVSKSYGLYMPTIELKPNTTYSAYVEYSFTGTMSSQWGFRVKINETWKSTVNSNFIKFTTDETGIVQLNFYIGFPYSGEGDTLILKNIRLYEGTYTKDDIPEYEPYGAMPSPEFRSEIRNVGDNVNEFDSEDWYTTLSAINSDNMQKETVDGIEYYKFRPYKLYDYQYMKGRFEENTQYAFAFKGRQYDVTDYQTTGFSIRYTDGTSSVIAIDKTIIEREYKVISDENKTIDCIGLYYSRDNYVLVRDIKLEKGTKVTPYSPYNCGNFNETVCNENLAYEGWAEDFVNRINNNSHASITEKNGKKFLFFSAAAGYVVGQDFKDHKQYFIKGPFKENTQYTFSGKIMLSTERKETNIAMRYTDGTISYSTLSEKAKAMEEFDFSLTSRADKTLYSIGVDYQTGQTYIDLLTATLKEGTSKEYIPHQSQQYTFPLKPGQRMYKDSYLADDGVHHKRGQYVLTGEFDWNLTVLENAYCFFVFNKTFNNMKIKEHFKSCNYFEYKMLGFRESSVPSLCENSLGSPNKLVIFKTDGTQGTTVEEWKTYLAEQYANRTPVIIEYELAEEIIEPYTEEQQLVYNEKKKAHSYKNVTHIFSTDEIKPVVEATYRKDLETMFNNINNAILGGN